MSSPPSEHLASRLTPTLDGDAGSEMIGERPNLSEDYSIIDESTSFYSGLTPDLDMVLGNAPISDSGAEFSLLDTTEPICLSPFMNTDSSEVTTVFGRRQRCSCSEMVRTYETAEVYLVWAARDHSGATSIEVDEILRCQKTVLASCEAVLSCDLCSLQSEQVMLMISICNKLLVSFIQMSAAPPPIAPGSMRSTKSGSCSPRQEQQSLDRRSSVKSRGFNFECSEWKIDDEDKKQVIKTLLNSRAARLNGLMDRLGEVVTTNRWLVHRSMIRDLLERLAEHQAMWKP